MIRHILVGLLSVVFLLAGLAIAQNPPGDDPPIRLKKKNKPEAVEKEKPEPVKPVDPPPIDPKEKDPKVKDPKEKDPKDDAAPEEPEMDEAEVLNRVGKNMRTAEDRLANRELNDATQQVQDDIIKDLDSLINKMQNGGGGDNQEQQNQDQQNQQNQDKKEQSGDKKQQSGGKVKPGMASRKRGLKGQQQRQARANQGKKPGGQKPGNQVAQAGQGNKPQSGKPGEKPGDKPNPNPAHEGGGGGQSQEGATKLAEVYKDVLGHLPETMRRGDERLLARAVHGQVQRADQAVLQHCGREEPQEGLTRAV